jgi:hypothetical protein
MESLSIEEKNQYISDILKIAREDQKPNFSQLQMALQSISAEPKDYNELRKIMEHSFHLPSMEKLLEKHGCVSRKHPLD